MDLSVQLCSSIPGKGKKMAFFNRDITTHPLSFRFILICNVLLQAITFLSSYRTNETAFCPHRLQWQKCIHILLPGKSNLSNRKHEEEFISVKHVISVGILCQSTLFLPHVEEPEGSVVILLLVVVVVADIMLGGGGGGVVLLVKLFVVDIKIVVIIVVVLVKVKFCPAWNVIKTWIFHAVEESHYISMASL